MNVQEGEKLEEKIECPACGGAANMSVSKNKTIFTWCKAIVDEETTEHCGYRGFLGRTKSREIIREINENRKDITHVQHEEQEDEAPEPTREPDSGDGGDSPPDGGAPRNDDDGKRNRKSIGAALLGSFISGDSSFN